MKPLFETDKACLQYNEEVNAIELIWKRVHDTPTYRLMFTKGLQFFKSCKARHWLSDIRKEGIVSIENAQWLTSQIFPEAIKHGLQKIAVVMDADILKDVYVKNVARLAGSDKMKYFDDPAKARAWLADQNSE